MFTGFRIFIAAVILFPAIAAQAAVPSVVTDIAPVQALVARVMGDLGEPAVIVRAGSSPHGYAMRPSEAGALQRSEAIFWIGPTLTPWLEDAIATLAQDASVTLLLEAAGTQVLDVRANSLFGPQERDDHDHVHVGHDPHAWLDPRNGQIWLGVIAERLSTLDPEHAAIYRANAKTGQAELVALEDELNQRLAPVRAIPFIVFHDAFQYFERRFDLTAVAAIALSDASSPGPARIEMVRNAVRDLGVRCVLSEPAFNPAVVQTVIQGTKARTASVDPMGAGIAPGATFYPTLLRKIADELVRCLE